jgi:ERCC4-type nuclease
MEVSNILDALLIRDGLAVSCAILTRLSCAPRDLFESICQEEAAGRADQCEHRYIGRVQLVPGIGRVTAETVLQMRKSYGAFQSLDDLSAIRGIGPKRLEKMRKLPDGWQGCTPK